MKGKLIGKRWDRQETGREGTSREGKGRNGIERKKRYGREVMVGKRSHGEKRRKDNME